jgi:RNA polymerase sigma-70 factor, ECF subfamily
METNHGVRIGSLLSEMQLIESIVGGDSRGFHDLIRPYERQLYKIALRMVSNPSDAEDVVQEALISAYRNLHKFRGDARFGTWLTTITINQARTRLRSQRPHRFSSIHEQVETENGSIPATELAQTGPSPFDIVEQNDLWRHVWNAVEKLNHSHRTVLLMQAYEGRSMESAAEALGISVPATKTRLHRARRTLQARLDPVFRARQQQSS